MIGYRLFIKAFLKEVENEVNQHVGVGTLNDLCFFQYWGHASIYYSQGFHNSPVLHL